MILEYSSYRTFLRETLIERVRKNPSYSLRAFAKGIGISPAMLSLVQSGKRNFLPDNAAKIARRLGLTGTEAEYFCALVQLEAAKTAEGKALHHLEEAKAKEKQLIDEAAEEGRKVLFAAKEEALKTKEAL